MTAHRSQEPRLTSRLVFVLAVISAIPPLSIDMYLPGFTDMARDLNTSAATIQLTLTAFLLGLAIGQLVIGALSDRYGRRNPLLISLAICTVAGIGCAIAPSSALLILLRFVQGFTGAAGVVIGRSAVRDLSEGKTAVKAFSVLAAIVSFGPVVAPLLGGGLIPIIGWRGVLAVLAATTLLMTVLIYLFVPESLSPEERSEGGVGTTLRTMAGLVANRPYLGYLTMVAFTFAAMFAYISASPFVFQNVYGLSTGQYALAFTFNAFGLILASAVNTRIVDHVDPAKTLAAAQAAMFVIAMALGISVVTDTATIYTVLPMTFLLVSSVGFTIANATALAMNAVSYGVGTAAALVGATQFAFGAIASPLVGLQGDESAVPMVIVIMAFTGLSLAALAWTRRAEASRYRQVERREMEGQASG